MIVGSVACIHASNLIRWAGISSDNPLEQFGEDRCAMAGSHDRARFRAHAGLVGHADLAFVTFAGCGVSQSVSSSHCRRRDVAPREYPRSKAARMIARIVPVLLAGGPARGCGQCHATPCRSGFCRLSAIARPISRCLPASPIPNCSRRRS